MSELTNERLDELLNSSSVNRYSAYDRDITDALIELLELRKANEQLKLNIKWRDDAFNGIATPEQDNE